MRRAHKKSSSSTLRNRGSAAGHSCRIPRARRPRPTLPTAPRASPYCPDCNLGAALLVPEPSYRLIYLSIPTASGEWLWEVDDLGSTPPPGHCSSQHLGYSAGAPQPSPGPDLWTGPHPALPFSPGCSFACIRFLRLSALVLRSSEIQVSRVKSRLHPLRSWMSDQDGERYSIKMKHSSVIYVTPISDFL